MSKDQRYQDVLDRMNHDYAYLSQLLLPRRQHDGLSKHLARAHQSMWAKRLCNLQTTLQGWQNSLKCISHVRRRVSKVLVDSQLDELGSFSTDYGSKVPELH